MEAIQVFDRPASQDFYSVAGRLLFIETTDLELRNLIVDLFAGWQLTPVPDPHPSPHIKISFFCGTMPQPNSLDLNQFEIAEGGKCYTDGANFFLSLGKAIVHLQHGRLVSIDVSFSEAPVAGDPILARAASFAVCAGLRRFGLFDLHSAGVVDPQSSKGVLIVGPSGSGKSTLAVQLARAGWSYLSDDGLLLSLVDGVVEARGFRRFFAMRTADRGDSLKHCFEPENVFTGKRATYAAPGLVVFTSLNGEGKSRLRKLSQGETMMRLLRACPWGTYDTAVAGDTLEVLSALARQANGFDLAAGRDVLEPDFAADLLSGHSHQN